jgi:DNA-binding response OmpR family regulator
VTAAGFRALVADDDAVARRFLGALLRNDGWEVREVADGEALLEAARASPPDLILMELMLPYKDGFEVLRALRQDEGLRRVPVVILSVRDREEDIVKCLGLGVEDYLTKPFNARELLARVHRAAERGRQAAATTR